MNITEVRIKLIPPEHGRLLAYASLVFDQCFCCHDVKILQGEKRLFVAMPSRRINIHCPVCNTRNVVNSQERLCVRCDKPLPRMKAIEGESGERSPFVDIFHPINAMGRHLIDAAVLHAYQQEVDKLKLYQSGAVV